MSLAGITPPFRRPVLLVGLALASAALVSIAAADARSTIMIGSEEVLRPLQDVRLQNGNGEPLYLGYRISFHWLGLPYAVSNDGYILGMKGKTSHIVIGQGRLAEWQAQGHLPSPLPSYRLGIADHLLGNLLWIVLAGVVGWAAYRITGQRAGHPAPAPASVPAHRLAQAAAPSRAPRAAARSAAVAAAPAGDPPPRAQSRLPVTAQMQPVPVPLAQVARLPVAKTVCRVKAVKTA